MDYTGRYIWQTSKRVMSQFECQSVQLDKNIFMFSAKCDKFKHSFTLGKALHMPKFQQIFCPIRVILSKNDAHNYSPSKGFWLAERLDNPPSEFEGDSGMRCLISLIYRLHFEQWSLYKIIEIIDSKSWIPSCHLERLTGYFHGNQGTREQHMENGK